LSKVTFYLVATATLARFYREVARIIYYHNQAYCGDDSPLLINLSKHLRAELKGADHNDVDIMKIIHAELDHICGF
jgi:hypothetical protein